MKKYLQFLKIEENSRFKYKSDEESTEDEKFHYKLLQILRNYGSISISKDRATEIIQRIIGGEEKYSNRRSKSSDPSNYKKPSLGYDVDFNFMKPSNKVRIYDYLKCLLETKTIRGDSFEGLVAGLYEGVVSTDKVSKFDVTLDTTETLSVKFVDSIKERPVLGNIKTDLMNNIDTKLKDKSLNEILTTIGPEKSFYILNDIAFSTVSHFLIAYPEDHKDPKNLDIHCLLFTREALLKRYIMDSDVRYQPKQKGSFQIRVNIGALKDIEDKKEWILKAPIITNDDLNYLMLNDTNIADKLFGTDKSRIRGSILNSIINFGQFKTIKGKEYFVFDFKKYKEERGY